MDKIENNVFSILEALANTSSRNEKESILRAFSDNKTLKECIRLAYDPFVLFYIKKPVSYTPQNGSYTSLDNALKDLIENLSTRKITGDAARKFLERLYESLSKEDANVLERVVAKDLRCGFTEGTANKIWPKLVPTYPCMLCEQMDEKLLTKIPFPAFFQMKMDGRRFNAIVRDGTVEYRSRNGQPNNLHGILDQYFIAMADGGNFVFDGELLVLDDKGVPLPRHIGNGLISKAQKGKADVISGLAASLWDVIPLNLFEKGYDATPYDIRFNELKSMVSSIKTPRISIVDTHIVKNMEEVQMFYQDYLAAGQEGGILKNMGGPWEDKRSRNQIKFKAELECDLKCVDVIMGKINSKYEGMVAGLQLESADGLIKTGVGSGLKLEQVEEFTKNPPVGKIVTIKYNARIKNSIFLPVFIEVRTDKDIADSSDRIK